MSVETFNDIKKLPADERTINNYMRAVRNFGEGNYLKTIIRSHVPEPLRDQCTAICKIEGLIC